MKICMVSLLYFFLLSACTGWKEKEVTITEDYVINPNWDEIDNSFEVCKMKLKDSSKAINLKDPSEMELDHGLVEDTRFSFITNVKYNGIDYSSRIQWFFMV